MSNKNRQTPHANQKRKNNLTLETITTIINIYIYIYIYIALITLWDSLNIRYYDIFR